MFGDIWENQYVSKKWKIENVLSKKIKVKNVSAKNLKIFLIATSVVEPIFGYSRITLTRTSPCRPGTGELGFTIGGNAGSA